MVIRNSARGAFKQYFNVRLAAKASWQARLSQSQVSSLSRASNAPNGIKEEISRAEGCTIGLIRHRGAHKKPPFTRSALDLARLGVTLT